MFIILATISIFAITGLFWLINRFLGLRVCPICVGVSGTWLWILAGLYIGWLEAESWKLLAAIAMGGSVVGIAYQMEKRLPAGRSQFFWKTFFIPAGFIAVYALIQFLWVVFAATAAALAVFAAFFLRSPKIPPYESNKKAEELEKKMKSCC